MLGIIERSIIGTLKSIMCVSLTPQTLGSGGFLCSGPYAWADMGIVMGNYRVLYVDTECIMHVFLLKRSMCSVSSSPGQFYL